mgnify:CR=1 FL=1
MNTKTQTMTTCIPTEHFFEGQYYELCFFDYIIILLFPFIFHLLAIPVGVALFSINAAIPECLHPCMSANKEFSVPEKWLYSRGCFSFGNGESSKCKRQPVSCVRWSMVAPDSHVMFEIIHSCLLTTLTNC